MKSVPVNIDRLASIVQWKVNCFDNMQAQLSDCQESRETDAAVTGSCHSLTHSFGKTVTTDRYFLKCLPCPSQR